MQIKFFCAFFFNDFFFFYHINWLLGNKIHIFTTIFIAFNTHPQKSAFASVLHMKYCNPWRFCHLVRLFMDAGMMESLNRFNILQQSMSCDHFNSFIHIFAVVYARSCVLLTSKHRGVVNKREPSSYGSCDEHECLHKSPSDYKQGIWHSQHRTATAAKRLDTLITHFFF